MLNGWYPLLYPLHCLFPAIAWRCLAIYPLDFSLQGIFPIVLVDFQFPVMLRSYGISHDFVANTSVVLHGFAVFFSVFFSGSHPRKLLLNYKTREKLMWWALNVALNVAFNVSGKILENHKEVSLQPEKSRSHPRNSHERTPSICCTKSSRSPGSLAPPLDDLDP